MWRELRGGCMRMCWRYAYVYTEGSTREREASSYVCVCYLIRCCMRMCWRYAYVCTEGSTREREASSYV